MRRKGNDWKRPVGRHPTVDKSGTVFLHRFVVLRFGRFGATKVKISPYPENEKLFHFIGETSPHTILSGNHTLSPGTQTYFLPLPDNYTGLIHTKSRQIQHKNRQIAVGTVRASAENRGSEAAPGSRTKPELRQNGIGRQSETPRPSQQPPDNSLRHNSRRHNSRPATCASRPTRNPYCETESRDNRPAKATSSRAQSQTGTSGYTKTGSAQIKQWRGNLQVSAPRIAQLLRFRNQIAPEIRKTAATVRMA